MPLCSVIVPVYNTAPYLPRCLNSILSQEGDFEVLAVDDGSQDESLSLLRDYEKKHSRLRVFTKENGGLSHTRNFALDRAEGEYLAFLDSDDYLHPNFIRSALGSALEQRSDLVLFDFFYAYDNTPPQRAKTAKGIAADPLREAVIAAPMACTRLFHRSLFQKKRFLVGSLYEDLELIPALSSHAESPLILEDALYYYYQRPGSIMHRRKGDPRREDIFAVMDRVEAHFRGREQFRSEVEYLFIEHLLRSAGIRLSGEEDAKELFRRLRKRTEQSFPQWKKNPYFKKVSPAFRLAVMLTAAGQPALLHYLACRKGM